jgi:hypothetical protein
MVETAKGEVMKLSTHTILRLFGGTVVLVAVAAFAAPTVAASGALDPWQQNLNAREKYMQMTDPWALNLLARQAHRDDPYATTGPSAVRRAGGRPATAPEITAGFAAPGSIHTSASHGAAVVEVGGSTGFHWSDAGIGAASALGVVLLTAGTAIALRKSGAIAHMHL